MKKIKPKKGKKAPRIQSLKKKFWLLGMLIGGSAVFSLVVFAITIIKIRSAQSSYQESVEMARLIGNLKADYLVMEASDFGFIADPANEGLADRKQKSDKAVVEESTLIAEKLKDPDILALIDKATSIHEKTLLPTSEEAYKLLSSDRMGVLKMYAMKMTPGYGLVDLTLNKAVKKINEKQDEVRIASNKVITLGSIILALALIFGVALSVFFIVRIGRSILLPLDLAMSSLTRESEQTRATASDIGTASETLASSTTEQAAAMQETAASVEELSAMTQKNAESATKSGQAANASSETALRGKRSVSEMITAIGDISESNNEIMAKVVESNAQFAQIVDVIAEIGTKTKVINEIVFQTKLLSFNASVEAARAGEHGKGFAVVAEEVGNLAQMSGNAAAEISRLLESSTKKVEIIVRTTKTSVEGLVANAKVKLDHGLVVVADSGRALDEIVESVSEMNRMVEDISLATAEQANGIDEISKAMGQVNEGMAQNSRVSQKVGELAHQLHRQSESLGSVVTSLACLIHGDKKA